MSDSSAHGDLHDHSWRNEVASRVQQHRARRGKTGNGSQALEFDFAAEEAMIVTDSPVLRHKLPATHFDDICVSEKEASANPERFLPPEPPKIIRFPRAASLPGDHPPNGLMVQSDSGEFFDDRSPRIIEVLDNQAAGNEAPGDPGGHKTAHTGPADLDHEIHTFAQPEQMELLPSFEDIQLEPAHVVPQIDDEVIPTPAGLAQRLVAGAVDISMVAAAVALFDSVFVRLAHDNPHSRMVLLCGLGVAGLLWVMMQYLFLVHGQGTPGMRFAQLELRTFGGKPVSASSRRCRAAASALSAFSVGLGYAWALVDEDRLGWHDRITGTLVRSSTEPGDRTAEVWTDFIGES